MSIFEKTAVEQQKIEEFKQKIQHTIQQLTPYKEQADITELQKLYDSFHRKTEDFYRNDRKLNIAVIGQVKAGKSTFLNNLLFNGNEVLPTARTPKTAVLTRIEYFPENRICVNFYSEEEWHLLEEMSKQEIYDNEHDVAREIMKMVKESGISPYEYISKKAEVVEFNSAEELTGQLNDYVGTSGKLTPFVKDVTIYVSKEELAEISIIDTPGLNDAVASRTDKTRAFIEKCDVVFFLSRTSQFLDSVDIQLITSQLPRKGVENLIMIGSKFDEGILDEIKKKPSFETVTKDIQQKQTQHAIDITARMTSDERFDTKFIQSCRNPIFISSIADNMAKKDLSQYDKSEKFVWQRLDKYCLINQQILHQIGNMDIVRKKFSEVIRQKDITLQNKAKQIIPNAQKEYQSVIQEITRNTRNTLELLQTSDKETIIKQKKLIQSQIAEIKSSLESVLGDLLISLEECKNECLRKLRQTARDNSRIQERQGTEWHTGSHIVGRHHFLCFSWGGHRESYSYSTTYTYLATSDALENIRNFGYDACSDIENSFMRAVDIRRTKRSVMNTILENFDTYDENFDVAQFRHIVEMTLNQLEFPVFKLDVSSYLDSISGKFSGEVKDAHSRNNLQNTLANVIEGLFNEVSAKFTTEVTSFRTKINNMKNSFAVSLLKNINNEYEKLQKQFANKEAEIENYRKAIQILQSV